MCQRTLMFIMCTLFGVSFSAREAGAVWGGDVSLRAQLESKALPKLIRVTKMTNIPARDVPSTEVAYDELDPFGFSTLASGTFSYPGGTQEDGTKVWSSHSPDMSVGEYYMVLVDANSGQLFLDAMSALPVIPNGPIDELGPTVTADSLVLLHRVHGAVVDPQTGCLDLVSTVPGLDNNFTAASVTVTVMDLSIALLQGLATPMFEVDQ